MSMSEEKKPLTISEMIEKKDYSRWKKGDIIFLNAHTGSGKTRFIIDVLLPHIIHLQNSMVATINRDRHKILYLVNRSILQGQIQEAITHKGHEYWIQETLMSRAMEDYITVSTYQRIEQELTSANYAATIFWLQSFTHIVYDECHYFLNDSNFNTNTEISFDCLRHIFDNKIQIFMSATMENMIDIIKTRTQKSPLRYEEYRYIEYKVKPDYSHVILKVFNDYEELKKIILKNQTGNNKWLIFIDSIKTGKKLKKALVASKEIPKEKVGFIDADYYKTEESNAIVTEITREYKTSKDILIATSVMDNGISLMDNDLHNIVIMADTKESFIQMLGRKRADNEKITLYICKRDASYFSKRLNQVGNVLKFYEDIRQNIEIMFRNLTISNITYPSLLLFMNPYTNQYISQDTKQDTDHDTSQDTDHDTIQDTNHDTNHDTIQDTNQNINQDTNQHINQYITFSYDKALDTILRSGYNYANKICYHIWGLFAINSFSIYKYRLLYTFYKSMLEKLEDDKNAFVYQQAEWLGLDYDNVVLSIQDSDDETDDMHRENICNIIKDYLDYNLDKTKNIELKMKLKKQVRYFLDRANPDKQIDSINNIYRDIGKNERPMSKEHFNDCMKYVQLSYTMETGKEKDNETGEEILIYKISESKVDTAKDDTTE